MTKERTCQGCNGKRRVWRGDTLGEGPCQACKAFGVVVDRITREDAMADAAAFGYISRPYWLTFYSAGALVTIKGEKWSEYSEDDPAIWSTEAARAAFRVVPALRVKA